MLRNAHHFLRTILIAVAVMASGANGYASVLTAFDTHSHGANGLHSHDHDHDHDGHRNGVDHQAGGDQEHIGAVADADTQSNGNPASDGQVCKHIHAYCCAMFAMAAADCGLSMAAHGSSAVPAGEAHILLGQLSSPLFRPPRASA